MLDDDQRRLLGEFVRAHRERVTVRAGAGRRRTPGLRREELAEAAGISTTWCAWIEQGRPVQPSPEALARLAAALQLSAAERAYLFKLAGRIDPSQLNRRRRLGAGGFTRHCRGAANAGLRTRPAMERALLERAGRAICFAAGLTATGIATCCALRF